MIDPTSERAWWIDLFESQVGKGYNLDHWSARNSLGENPALIVVDVVRSFTGGEGQELEEATADYPTACGPTAWAAMPHLQHVIALAEKKSWPVVHTTGLPGGATLYGGTVKADLGGLNSPMDLPGAQDIPDQIMPSEDALVLAKPKASAFFDTPLLSFLIRRKVDSLIITGTTTSGCVRATVTDAHSHGFPTFVVEEATFDRSRLSHGVNLFEMNAKYADVVSVSRLQQLAERGRPR